MIEGEKEIQEREKRIKVTAAGSGYATKIIYWTVENRIWFLVNNGWRYLDNPLDRQLYPTMTQWTTVGKLRIYVIYDNSNKVTYLDLKE